MKAVKVSKALLEEAINNIFAPCSSYYAIRKGVIKKMAIDYKKEWEELHKDASPELRFLMNTQIERTIGKRESLMKEYIKKDITTDIAQGYRTSYDVKVFYDDRWFGTVNISKSNFDAWCKKKGDK